MADEIGIKNAIEKASGESMEDCLEILRKEMVDLGYGFKEDDKGRKRAYEEAKRHYWNIMENEFPLSDFDKCLDSLYDTKELPGTRLEINHRTLHTRGRSWLSLE